VNRRALRGVKRKCGGMTDDFNGAAGDFVWGGVKLLQCQRSLENFYRIKKRRKYLLAGNLFLILDKQGIINCQDGKSFPFHYHPFYPHLEEGDGLGGKDEKDLKN